MMADCPWCLHELDGQHVNEEEGCNNSYCGCTYPWQSDNYIAVLIDGDGLVLHWRFVKGKQNG